MLARRLEEMRLRWRLSKKEMAEKLGISIPYYSEIITGKKTGMRKIVEFAKRLGVSVEWLTGDQSLIPLVSEVTASSPFQFRENGYLELFAITLPVITKQTVMNFYALRVRGDSMIPSHKDRDILIVERNSHGKIKHGDTVILHKEEGSYVMSLDLKDKIPKLRPLDLTGYYKEAEQVSLTRLDKVVFTISS
jgi:SOS-response transcriptional repressor LexA